MFFLFFLFFVVVVVVSDGPDLQQKQYEWIEQDLIQSNLNRDAVPWLVVFGHRSIYCSCDADCDASAQTLRDGPFYNSTTQNRTWSYEDVFFTQGVDLFINGHEHDYERNYPTYRSKSDLSNIDPHATVYIVTGAAGCDELHEPFTRPQPPRSAFRSNNFGYSQIIVHNTTTLQFQQIMTDPTFFGPADYGRIIDDVFIVSLSHSQLLLLFAQQLIFVSFFFFLLFSFQTSKVQHSHGPFDPAQAPTGESNPSAPASISRDHWATILKEEFGAEYQINETNTQELIQQWRDNNQNSKISWKQKEDDLKTQFENAGLGKTKWEDVRMDGSSDGATFGATKPQLIPGIGDPREKKD